jgi:hypothetical protein
MKQDVAFAAPTKVTVTAVSRHSYKTLQSRRFSSSTDEEFLIDARR